MGLLNLFKAVGSVAAGKKTTLELPADIDTSSIDAAISTAQEIADNYLATHPSSEYRIIVKFNHPQTLNGKPVFIEINVEYCFDAPLVSLFLPFDDKENEHFMKKYKEIHNLSVNPAMPHIAFEYPGYYDWCFIGSNTFFTDVITHLGLNPNVPWVKGETRCSVTTTEIS